MVKRIIIDDMIWALTKMDTFLMLYELIDTFLKVIDQTLTKKL